MTVKGALSIALRFGFVGAVCSMLNICIVWVDTERWHWPYPFAAGSTCLVTIPLAYALHRRISFDVETQADWPEFWRFCMAQLSQFALGLILIAVTVEFSDWRPWIAMAAVSAAMACYGFAMSSVWVFRMWPFRQNSRPSRAENSPLRVLQVSAFFPAHGGGIEVVAGELANRLAAEGIQVTWMAGGHIDERPEAGGIVGLTIDQAGSIDFLERSLGLPAPVWNIASLRRLWFHVGAVDVVHVHDYLYMSSLAAIAFARWRKRPIILTQHIGDIAFDSLFARTVLRFLNRTLGRGVLARVDQVVFVGRPAMIFFDALIRYRRLPLLISNGVDHARYRPNPNRIPRATEAPLEMLFVGRFVEKKGLDLLRECATLPGVHWTFVGSGPLTPQNWKYEPSQVDLLGVLPPDQVAAVMQRADLLVLPSKGEGFPLVVQESLACGTPVLVSLEVANAFPEINEQCVLSVDLDSDNGDKLVTAKRLREKVEQIVDDPKALEEARPIAAMLAEQWSWQRCVAAYVELYNLI